EFKEEEDPQEEEEDNMEVDIEEDKNEPELTYTYEELDPLNPPPPASVSEPKDDGDSLLPDFMRRDTDSLFGKAKDKYDGKLILDLGNEVHSSVEQGTAAMQKLVEKLGNAEDKAEYKKLKKELEEARLSNTFLPAIRRMIKENVDAAIAAERVRQVNVRIDASGSRLVRGQDTTPTVRECTFAGFMKCNSTVFHGTEGAIKLQRWFEKTKSIFGISECAEGKKVKFAAAILQGPALTWWNAKVSTMGLETIN
nr:putative reverse transcriptase domain-containing protein [Tanacetum cinerariifolium]